MQYHQFCPVSKAAEILGERWNLLIIRELLCGSTRFNDLQRALGGISPSLLTKRLKELELAGMVSRQIGGSGRKASYTPTAAGQALLPIIIAVGDWGMQYARGDMTDEEMDLDLLMWDIRRRIADEHIPGRRATLRFVFTDQQPRYANWWITVDGQERELCTEQPEPGEDITFRCPARVMINVWMGDVTLEDAQRQGQLKIDGNDSLRQRMRQWLGLSVFTPDRRSERSAG